MLRNFFAHEELGRHLEGQTLVEYAMLIALLVVGCVSAMMALSDPVTGIFGAILAGLAKLNDL